MTVYRFPFDRYNTKHYITQNEAIMTVKTGGQVYRMLVREADWGDTPEGKLWATVISEAWSDAAKEWRHAPKRKHEGEACKFFLFGGASHIANLIGWDGDMLRYFLNHHPRGVE